MICPSLRNVALTGALLLAGCGAPETTRRADTSADIPALRMIKEAPVVAPSGRNDRIARDILDLTFEHETGQRLNTLSRFEGPITVALTGPASSALSSDLDRLIGRLAREARLDISRAQGGAPASITVEVVTRGQIQSVAAGAACFVRPGVSSFAEFRARRGEAGTRWIGLTERTRMAVFLPGDASPQEQRDCLHEEVAQALGPVNDIYRLTESVFNDDNFHTVLTGFDMLVLRAIYHPSLRAGMSKADVTARLPGILAELNPAGGRAGVAPPPVALPGWKDAIETASSRGGTPTRKRAAAERAVRIASGSPYGIADPRLAYSHYVLGRRLLGTDPDAAQLAFINAGRLYEARGDTKLHAAHVALQVGALQLGAGRPDLALGLIEPHIATVRGAGNAYLLSLLLMVKAEALALTATPTEARAAEAEALSWAPYGFGDRRSIEEQRRGIHAIATASSSSASL